MLGVLEGISSFCRTEEGTAVVMHVSMLSPRGGTSGICGAFDFFEEFLIKTPTLGSKNGSNQVKSPYPGDKLY